MERHNHSLSPNGGPTDFSPLGELSPESRQQGLEPNLTSQPRVVTRATVPSLRSGTRRGPEEVQLQGSQNIRLTSYSSNSRAQTHPVTSYSDFPLNVASVNTGHPILPHPRPGLRTPNSIDLPNSSSTRLNSGSSLSNPTLLNVGTVGSRALSTSTISTGGATRVAQNLTGPVLPSNSSSASSAQRTRVTSTSTSAPNLTSAGTLSNTSSRENASNLSFDPDLHDSEGLDERYDPADLPSIMEEEYGAFTTPVTTSTGFIQRVPTTVATARFPATTSVDGRVPLAAAIIPPTAATAVATTTTAANTASTIAASGLDVTALLSQLTPSQTVALFQQLLTAQSLSAGSTTQMHATVPCAMSVATTLPITSLATALTGREIPSSRTGAHTAPTTLISPTTSLVTTLAACNVPSSHMDAHTTPTTLAGPTTSPATTLAARVVTPNHTDTHTVPTTLIVPTTSLATTLPARPVTPNHTDAHTAATNLIVPTTSVATTLAARFVTPDHTDAHTAYATTAGTATSLATTLAARFVTPNHTDAHTAFTTTTVATTSADRFVTPNHTVAPVVTTTVPTTTGTVPTALAEIPVAQNNYLPVAYMIPFTYNAVGQTTFAPGVASPTTSPPTTTAAVAAGFTTVPTAQLTRERPAEPATTARDHVATTTTTTTHNEPYTRRVTDQLNDPVGVDEDLSPITGTLLLSPRHTGQLISRQGAPGRNNQVRFTTGTPLDVMHNPIGWATTSYQEYRALLLASPTAYADTVVLVPHDKVSHHGLEIVPYPGLTATSVIPTAFLAPHLAYADINKYKKRTVESFGDFIVMVALGKDHVREICDWPDQMGNTAPLSARQLAKPPPTDEHATLQRHRMSFATLTLGPCTVDAVEACVGFQLILEPLPSSVPTQPCDAISGFLVLMPYQCQMVLKNFLEIFHSQCIALRVLVKTLLDRLIQENVIDYTMAMMSCLPSVLWGPNVWSSPIMYEPDPRVTFAIPRMALPTERRTLPTARANTGSGWEVEEQGARSALVQRPRQEAARGAVAEGDTWSDVVELPPRHPHTNRQPPRREDVRDNQRLTNRRDNSQREVTREEPVPTTYDRRRTLRDDDYVDRHSQDHSQREVTRERSPQPTATYAVPRGRSPHRHNVEDALMGHHYSGIRLPRRRDRSNSVGDGPYLARRPRLDHDGLPWAATTMAGGQHLVYSPNPFSAYSRRERVPHHPYLPPYRDWRGFDPYERDSSAGSGENRAKMIESGASLLRVELNLTPSSQFTEKGDLFLLGKKLFVLKEMLACSNDIIFWVLHNVCNDPIRNFLMSLKNDFSIEDEDMEIVPFLMHEIMKRFMTPSYLTGITEAFHEATMHSSEDFSAFWERVSQARSRYCMATATAHDNQAFLRTILKGISHREDLLQEHDRLFGSDLETIREALIKIDAGHQRKSASRNVHSRPANSSASSSSAKPSYRNQPSANHTPIASRQQGGLVTQGGESHPVPNNPPKDHDKKWNDTFSGWMTWCSAHAKWTNHNIDECNLNKRRVVSTTKETLQLTIPHSSLSEPIIPFDNVPGETVTMESVATTSTLPVPAAVGTPALEPSFIAGLTPPDQRRRLPAVDLLVEGVSTEVLIDWGSTVNVVNPKRVNVSGAIMMGKCSIKFDGAIKSMSSSSLTLDRALLSFKATDTSKEVILECWLCNDVEFSALMAHYAYEILFSGQVSDMCDNRVLTVRDTGATVPYRLVNVNLATVRAIQDQTIVTWSATHEVQIPGSAHCIVPLSTDITPIGPDTHLFELHPSMTSSEVFHVLADIPLFDTDSGTFSVVVQNMTTTPLVLRQGLCLLLSRQMQPVVA